MGERESEYRAGRHEGERVWHAAALSALRRRMGLTQQELAAELGVRQQTVSEWETGVYRPRGASARLLGIVAERAGFSYGEPSPGGEDASGDDGGSSAGAAGPERET